jgi:hypothetical protein
VQPSYVLLPDARLVLQLTASCFSCAVGLSRRSLQQQVNALLIASVQTAECKLPVASEFVAELCSVHRCACLVCWLSCKRLCLASVFSSTALECGGVVNVCLHDLLQLYWGTSDMQQRR